MGKPNQEFTAMAVIDSAIVGLFIYDAPSDMEEEDVEEFLISKGHRLSNVSWGYFDGIVEDQRND
jgi:hypothetical protein